MMYFDKKRIEARTASVSQIAFARECVIENGPGRGVRIIDIDNGTGVHVTVLVDRGMDLGRCTYRGVPITFETPSGVTHPAYYDPRGTNWLRTWEGGLVTGTGMRNVGVPQSSDGPDDPLGLHGRLSHTPGTLTAVEESWEDDKYVITVRGKVRESSFFGDNLLLERVIRVESVSNTIRVTDAVTNEGPRISPFMILYHCNFGYPLIDDHTRIECDIASLTPRDDEAAAHLDDWAAMSSPQERYRERCYYPDVKEERGRCQISLRNPDLPFVAALDWRKRELPFATIWKMLGTREYALGLEPANCRPDGQAGAREDGTLEMLEPGGRRELDLRLSLLDNGADLP